MRRVIAMLILPLLLCGCAPSQAREPLSPLTLYAIKSGKADAFVLSCGGQTMVLDTGEKDDGDKIVEILETLSAERIDVLLLSHYDKDHVGGAPYLLEHMQVETIIDPDYEADGDAAQDYLTALEDISATRHQPDSPVEFMLGEAKVAVYPTQLDTAEDNDRSLIVTVTHGDVTFLFPGDAEKDRLAEWLTEHKEKYTFLKAPHHGRWNSMSKIFYMTVDPEFCLITASDKNPPDDETLSILNNLQVQTHITRDGTASYISDGVNLTREE